MAHDFDSFVILAEMRTGSNLLEETLNQVPGLACHGEAFNPVHLGGPNRSALLGVSKAERDADPFPLLERIRAEPGLNGFRFFHDHDPRVLRRVLSDPRCAKIVLTRNPLDSYVSLKIARDTGTWRTSDPRSRRAAKPAFVPAEFESFLDQRQAFQRQVLHALQMTGQTAFYLDYEDVQSVEIVNGLLAFLGAKGKVAHVSRRLLPQNPEALPDKVSNFAEMERALGAIDWAQLSRLPNFEPRRGPGAPRAVAAAGAPLLYLPVPSVADGPVRAWLSGLGSGGLTEGFTQKSLRDWMRARPGFRSFAVVCHPLLRSYAIFRRVLVDAEFEGLRIGLREAWAVPLPPEGAGVGPPRSERAAFVGFLGFLRANLNGQTPVQQNILWASQTAILEGMAQFRGPDLIARAETLGADLGHLAALTGAEAPPASVAEAMTEERAGLARFCDRTVEAASLAAYGRDYQLLGYGRELPAP